MENTVEITVFQLFDNLPLNIALKCWWKLIPPYQNWGKTVHSIFKMDCINSLSKFQTRWQCHRYYGNYYRNHCFPIIWQSSTEHCLKKFMDWIPHIQIEENTLFHIQNRFLEAFIKYQTSLQGQWCNGKYCGDHCFPAFENLPLNMA